MNRKNFGDESGIVVDVCARHGVWFDTGELPKILAFTRAGGLERAKKRRAEAARQEEGRGNVALMIESTRQQYESEISWVEMIADAGLSLLDAAIDAIASLAGKPGS
jgi:Zn-finger nucleic acid-binding protein